MTYLITEPQVLAAAAADVEQIGSAISAANAAAAGPTAALVAPAGDEVSAAITQLFGAYSQDYQAVVAKAAAFHGQFTQALSAAGGAYAAAEAAASQALGAFEASPMASTSANSAATVAIVIGGSGNPIPGQPYIDGVLRWATQGGFTWNTVQALFTPEGLYPLTGTKSLPLDMSVSQGVQILDGAIKQQIAAGNSVLVQGYSQSSIIASLEMQNLLASPNPPTGTQLSFNLLGDPMNPNGGLLARFAGLTFPSVGLDFYGATPANTPWTTNIYSLEYDGFADFPRYPIDIFADLNAIAGIAFVHPTYTHIDPATLPSGDIVKLPVSPSYTGPLANTTYWMVLTPDLPLLDPLRAIPVVGNPLADLLQPDLTYLVNWGYGDPNYGYSTAPANVPTGFGLFPPLSATAALPGDLVLGTQLGISAATNDVIAEGMTGASLPSLILSGASPSGLSPSGIVQSLSSISFPSPATLLSPASIVGSLQSLEAANTALTNAVSKAASDSYSTLLPTADILNATVISIPSYDVNLFLNGIAQAATGDPVGLINAVGDPIAATTGLLTFAGGIEGLFLIISAGNVIGDFTSLIP